MRTLHLFAGIGGGLLADLILGHRPVCAVEIDPYCCRVLRERRDEGWFPDLHVHEGDVRLWDPSDWAGRVDCIAAGFPCQDLSCAGKRAGIYGSRSGLWTEVVRAVDAIRPEWVFMENSPRIRASRAVVVDEFLARGYAWRDGSLEAAQCGSPWGYLRSRWWFLARLRESDAPLDPQARDTLRVGRVGWEDRQETEEPSGIVTAKGEAWNVEPAVGRVVSRLPSRVDRIKGLGNAQVPLQAALAWILLGGPVA